MTYGYLHNFLRKILTPNLITTIFTIIYLAFLTKWILSFLKKHFSPTPLVKSEETELIPTSIYQNINNAEEQQDSTISSQSITSSTTCTTSPPILESSSLLATIPSQSSFTTINASSSASTTSSTLDIPDRPKYILNRFAFPITHTIDSDAKPLTFHLPALEQTNKHKLSLLPSAFSVSASASSSRSSTSISSIISTHNQQSQGKLQILLLGNDVLISASIPTTTTTSLSQPSSSATPLYTIAPTALSIIQWLCQNNCEIYLVLQSTTKNEEKSMLSVLKQSQCISSSTILPSHVLICQQSDTIISYARQLLPTLFITNQFSHTVSTFSMIPFVVIIKPTFQSPDQFQQQQAQYQTMLTKHKTTSTLSTISCTPQYHFTTHLQHIKQI